MNNCGKGPASRASLEKQMQAFDRLPVAARAALREAYENWAAFPLQRQWEQGRYRSNEHLVASLRASDATARACTATEIKRHRNRQRRTS